MKALRSLRLILACAFALPRWTTSADTEPIDSRVNLTPSIVEVGEDFAVHRSLVRTARGGGRSSWQTNQFTKFGNAIHYFEEGRWKLSRNKIDARGPGRFSALEGPHKATFARTLDSDRVFEVTMSDGRQYAGAIRGIQLTDRQSGESRWIGKVKARAIGQLSPPNQIRFLDAFDGLDADVVYEWRHDRFTQDVILHARPMLPQEWDPANVRVEVVTDLWTSSPPLVHRQTTAEPDGGLLDDAALIDLGRMKLIVGHAFPEVEGQAFRFGEPEDDPAAIPVQKRWSDAADGWHTLVESVRWDLVAPHLARFASNLPKAVPGSRGGYVVDFIIVPENQITDFFNGFTYYVQSNYYVSAHVTFHPTTVLKYKDNAHMRIAGSMTFPSAQPHAIFTSRNDDLYGERIAGVPGEVDSDGDPALHRASEALFFYYLTQPNTVGNVRIRWARTCLRYLGTALGVPQTLAGSLLEQADTGIDANVPATSEVTLNADQRLMVATPVTGNYVSGTLSEVLVNASNFPESQAEPAVAVREITPGDTVNTKVVCVALSRTHPGNGEDQGLVRMVSDDGGQTWPVVGYIATGLDGTDLPKADPDGDPCLVYDEFNNLFLAYRGLGNVGAVCTISTNDGLSFRKVAGFDGSLYPGATPRLAVGQRGGAAYGALWISLANLSSGIQCAGTDIRGFGWENVGGSANWVFSPLVTPQSKFHNIAVGPNGKVMLVYTISDPTVPPVTFYTVQNFTGYPSMSFVPVDSATFALDNMHEITSGTTTLLAIPSLAWDRPRNALYLAYATRAPGAPERDTDCMLRSFDWDNMRWNPEVRVHAESAHSQFHPAVAVDESSGYVAVIWYDNRDDATNQYSSLYGSFSRDGFAFGSKGMFRLSPTAYWSTTSGVDLKEYIGLTCFQGSYYPAFLHNSSGANTDWDIFCGRIPF